MDLDDEELKATRMMNGADRNSRIKEETNEEEKKAIETLKQISKQCHNSKECWENEDCCDCYIEVEDILAIDTILNLIEKQQKEIEKLKNDYNNLSDSLVVKNHCIKNSIPVEVIKDKMEEIKSMINYLKQFGYTSRLHELRVKKRVLQELLEERN